MSKFTPEEMALVAEALKPVVEEVVRPVATEVTDLKDTVHRDKLTRVSALKMAKQVDEMHAKMNDPEDGIIVRVNKNTDFRETWAEQIECDHDAVTSLMGWRGAVNKGMWVFTAAVLTAVSTGLAALFTTS